MPLGQRVQVSPTMNFSATYGLSATLSERRLAMTSILRKSRQKGHPKSLSLQLRGAQSKTETLDAVSHAGNYKLIRLRLLANVKPSSHKTDLVIRYYQVRCREGRMVFLRCK